MADLLLGLGAAVVKVACKVWLKNDAFAADASAEVADIVKGKVAGQLDQRHAQRLFEDLEVPVAEKLGVLRQHEFAGMPDYEWNAAVIAAGDTLRGARFTDADIFAGDLDPLYLRRRIVASNPRATRDLSEGGSELYDRLLTECSAYIVELTSLLPRFSAGAFAEILRRQSMLLQRVRDVLDRMPSADAVRTGGARAEADFAAAYRRQVVNRLDRLELFGVTVSESVRGYPLSTAYIPLAVAGDSLLARSPESQLAGDGGPGPGTLRIDDALAGTTRLFLRGEAGSGKTTLLQWLGLQAARRNFSARLGGWNETVPFLIRLRQYAGTDLPAPENFLGQVGQHIADDMPKGWVHRLLREGRALVLVDGVDELPAAQRRRARDWLAGLTQEFPTSKYVVTSRPGAASSEWLDREGFDAAEVQPMSWPDVREFVGHWHAAFRGESADAEQRVHLAQCESALLEAMYRRRDLRLLATSPLLCALICALNLDRRTQLPDDRMELYAVALDMLLNRRDVERQIPVGNSPLSKTSKTLLLEDLAYWLIRNGWSDAPKSRAIERIAQRLTTMPQVGTDGSAVLEGLIERSGLIREPVAERIDFVHRTFQEYLAAHAAVSDDQIGELIRNAHDDQWRPVAEMAAGHAQPRQREELIGGLLARAEAEPRKRQILQTLAVACRENSPELDPALSAQIQGVATSLLPPSNVRQAEILARIGEPLLDLLAKRPVHGVHQAVASIRAASLVGGDAAIKLIASYAQVEGQKVDNELMRAWPLLDVKQFARNVLSDSTHGTSVLLSDAELLPGLRYIRGLSNLSLFFPDGYGNVFVARDLPALSSINIMRDPALRDITALCDHPALTRVYLQDGDSLNLSPLKTLPNLRTLGFDPGRVRGLEALSDCPGISEIMLISARVNQIEGSLSAGLLASLHLTASDLHDLKPLIRIPQLAELAELSLRECGGLRSIDAIGKWAETLRSFTLWQSGFMVDVSPLANFPQLQRLDLGWHTDFNLTIIRKLPALRELYLYDDRRPIDLAPLEGVANLQVNVPRRRQVRGVEALGEGSKLVRF